MLAGESDDAGSEYASRAGTGVKREGDECDGLKTSRTMPSIGQSFSCHFFCVFFESNTKKKERMMDAELHTINGAGCPAGPCHDEEPIRPEMRLSESFLLSASQVFAVV